uniref:Uncharacterized protein n=1 Tax=Medicago truncatula TaxID=3880 RepID=A2Q2C3_MEDTR|nr:hypothetical protein MtrDRAFT_AC150207g30v2 [Medicago truncatula]
MSRKICTRIYPPRRTFRDIIRHLISICLDVIQAGSSANNLKSLIHMKYLQLKL